MLYTALDKLGRSIGSSVNSLSQLRLCVACFIFVLHEKKYLIERIFRYTEKHLKLLQNGIQPLPPQIYIIIILCV